MKTCPKCRLRLSDSSSRCPVDGADLVPFEDPRLGTTLQGRYVLERVLGEGGMATVYRARHKIVDRPCAIKVISAAFARDAVVRERFRREAKAAGKLAHPNIIEIFDQGETEDGAAYLVMELLEGEPLSDLMDRGPVPLSRALGILVQVARALARAHDFEVIHRDLKPENVFLCKRTDAAAGDLVKLLDFGIARSMQDQRLTAAGEVFGTPQYMAPERITSIDAGPAADLYAVGVLVHEMLTGQLPFNAPEVATLFIKHLKEPPPPLRTVLASVPESVEKLVLSLLAKDPKKRPVDAHRLHADLVAICREQNVPLPAEPAVEPPSSREPPPMLPPAALDHWVRRTALFEEMLVVAASTQTAGGRPPTEAAALLEQVKTGVAELRRMQDRLVAEQRALEGIESRGFEGRQRFGFAVDALGVDASRARDEARERHTRATDLAKATDACRRRLLEVHKEIVFWEGRSGFREPYEDLRQAYAAATEAVGEWLEARAADKEAAAAATAKDQEVADLAFQIQELRGALAKMEQQVEAEKGDCEARVRTIDAEIDAAQATLRDLGSRFCAPLRRKQELKSLFQQLDAEAAPG